MKRHLLLLVLIPMIGLLLAGCAKDDAVSPPLDPNDQLYGSAQTDDQFFTLYVQNDEYFRTDEMTMNDGEEPVGFDDVAIGKTLTPIRPLRWARAIRSVTRQVTRDSSTSDSLVYLTVTKTWTGVLVIAASYDDTSTVPDTVIRKPFTTQSTKRFIFRRISDDRIVWRRWRAAAVSLIDGGTTSSSAIDLTQLKLFFERNGVPDSIVVTDPNATFIRFWRFRPGPGHDLPDIVGGRPVRIQVTVVSTDPDTDHVVLRHGYSFDGMRRRRIRLQLVSEQFDGSVYTRVYERSFMMHFRRGVFSAVVDAMTHGTLFDDTADVSTSFWGAPYVVTQ